MVQCIWGGWKGNRGQDMEYITTKMKIFSLGSGGMTFLMAGASTCSKMGKSTWGNSGEAGRKDKDYIYIKKVIIIYILRR